MRVLGIRRARQRAEALLDRWSVVHPLDIDVESFAADFGARICEVPLDGATARLTRWAGDIRIAISDNTYDAFERRFLIAHELGHLALEHPSCAPSELVSVRPRPDIDTPAAWTPAAPHTPTDWKAGPERSYEAEADAFALELLMPRRLIEPRCDTAPVTLDVAIQIAAVYRVSVPAAALRVVELTSERCAAVLAVGGRVRWATRSRSLSVALHRDPSLHEGSLAFEYSARGHVRDTPRSVPARAWFKTDKRAPVVEHTLVAPGHAATLSMVWVGDTSAARMGIE